MRALALALSLVAPLGALAAQHPANHAGQSDQAGDHGAALPQVTRPALRPTARVAASPAPVVTIVTKDYAFDAPDTMTAGLTTLRLRNEGTEMHHVQLVRLGQGKTLADFLAAMQAGGPPPAWTHDVGGPNAPVPGGENEATLDLQAGRYAMVCFIPSPDGKPHIMKGMAKEVVVLAPPKAMRSAKAKGAKEKGSLAKVDATMTLSDYRFALSRPLVAGTQVVRVRNAARQSHEVFVVALAPGKTAADLNAWVQKMEGPPPARPIAGTTGMATGVWNDITLVLEPGRYAFLCFLPDAKDGRMHTEHGMMHEFTIPAARSASRGTR